MPVSGSLGTMAVLLFETALGGLALLWVAPLWGVVRPGFFKLAGSVLVACAAIAWATGRSAISHVGWTAYAGQTPPSSSPATLAVNLLGVFALAMAGWYVVVWAGWAPRPQPAATAPAKDGTDPAGPAAAAGPVPRTGGGRAL